MRKDKMSGIILLVLLSTLTAGNAIDARNDNGKAAGSVLNISVHVYTDVNFTNHFSTSKEATDYLLRFLKSVFLRFQKARPHLKLYLRNITLLNDTKVEDECFSYGEFNHSAYYASHRSPTKYVKLENSLRTFKNCTKNATSPAYRTNNASLVLVLTSYETRKVGGIAGFQPWPGLASKKAGICTEDNLAISPDMPGVYIGVLAAVRVLGHLMGAEYDDLRKGKGASNPDCQASDRFVMSRFENKEQSNRFSDCSLEEMEATLKNMTCTDTGPEPPEYKINSTIKYPGEDMSREVQCKKIRPNYVAAGRNKYQCLLECQHTGVSVGGLFTYQMLDGQHCTDEQFCYGGLCSDRAPAGHE
ncbi:uncharacterized protein LOC135373742 [Ornithodoros turicata]|uniref:uncharacterized protein LOC135373742 n=1 Tax=Ornithodoros turicata TaxID=34597 RepID=UPI003139DAD7